MIPKPVWADVPTLLRQNGIAPVGPTAALDFTLPDLASTERALSDFSGQWVLLTFFATWCGPCATELPTLQALHAAMNGKGFMVLGVALDQDTRAVSGFVRQKGVEFPVLVDKNGQVATLYRASAVPVSYLVDPSAQVVGVARGARNWSGMAALASDLLTLAPPDPKRAPTYATLALDLPPTLTPPEGEAQLLSTSVETHKPFDLLVALRWPGGLQEYVPLPPKLSLPDGLRQLGIRAESHSGAGPATASYTLTLTADKPGSYALDPVELRYTPHGAETQTRRITGPTVRVTAPSYAWLLWLLALIPLSVLITWTARRRSRGAPTELQKSSNRQACYEEARAMSVRGDGVEFLRAVLAFWEADEARVAAMRQRQEQAQFGGGALSSHEMQGMLHDMERALSFETRSGGL